jgi:hypothetical protein
MVFIIALCLLFFRIDNNIEDHNQIILHRIPGNRVNTIPAAIINYDGASECNILLSPTYECEDSLLSRYNTRNINNHSIFLYHMIEMIILPTILK